jgi:predicted HTH transcriptional regulator
MDSIYDLIKGGESEQVDFKQTISAIKIARTLVAFANTKGGRILIGVKDDKTITGIDPEEELFVMEQAAQKYCSPPILFTYQIFEYHQKAILIIEVTESKQKPHFAIDKDNHLQIFMRVGDKNHTI